MTYGLIGKTPKQVNQNSGIYNVADAYHLTKNKKWGGAWELIESKDSNSSNPVNSLKFTNLQEDKYFSHCIVFRAFKIRTSADTLAVRYSVDGGTNMLTDSSYSHKMYKLDADGSGNDTAEESDTSRISRIFQNGVHNTTNGLTMSGIFTLSNAGNPSEPTTLFCHTANFTTSAVLQAKIGGGFYSPERIINCIEFFTTATNTFDYDVSIYGMAR
jgi:hypothetical protein